MFEKYKKLIYSQICAIMAIVAAALAFLRYQQTQNAMEQITLSFILFAIVLFGMELKLLLSWLKENKKN